MASKRFNYQWRLFLPMVISLWVIIVGMAFWQVYRVKQTRTEMIHDQLKVVGDRIVDLYSEGNDPMPFIRFANKFYKHSHEYDELSIQVKDTNTDSILCSSGPHINLPKRLEANLYGTFQEYDNKEHFNRKYVYYSAYSTDGRAVAYVVLPYTKKLVQYISAKTTRFWMIFIAIGIFATILAYVSTVYSSRNIKILRNFATNASSDPNFVCPEDSNFPHDELGDITRQIVRIYNQRTIERERREKEHQVALHAIEEKARIKRELTSNINHELKTPVGIIKGYIDTIVSTPDMDREQLDHFLAKAQANVDRLIALMSDVTVITRLESGDKLINITDVDFHDLVFNLANEIDETNMLEDKMVFKYDIPLRCEVYANESLLNSMLSNLLRNALIYSQGTECHLNFVKEENGFYHFEFYDDGVGVPPEHLPHMFERFYRVNAGRSRNAGGTGLGLSIVKVTIDSFGGTIEVDNRNPSGLIYRFTLPKYVGRRASQQA